MKRITIKTISLLLTLMTLLSMIVACGDDGEVTADTSADNTTAPADETTAEEELAPIMLADLGNYFVIRPEKTSSDLLEKINGLYQKLKTDTGIGYKDDFYRENTPAYAIGEYEILVGKTNRPETAQFLENMKYEDYGFAQIGKKIVIAGHSEEATIRAISAFMDQVVYNDKNGDVFYSSEMNFLKIQSYDIGSINLGGVPIRNFRLVYPKKNNQSEKVAATMIADAIAASSGHIVEIVHDGEEATEYEILIGATNRHTDAEIAAMGEKLGATEAVIKFDGKKVAIYGTTSTGILVATNKFVDEFENKTAETLEVTPAAEVICKYDDSILTAMSFNVWVSGKTAERNARVLTMVRNYFPDTIGFQEVDPTWLGVLRDGLKDQYAYVGEGRNGGNSGEYNPIFYKKELFKLIEGGTKWLSDTPNVVSKYDESSLPRIYTYALLERKSDGKRIMVVNTHFDHTSAEAREKQAKVLVKYLNTITDYPIVLTGDFNCTSSTSAYSTIINCGMSNAYDIADKRENNAATFTNYGSSNKIIDFVFVSPTKVAVTFYKVCNEKINNDFPSDHHPVLIEYAILG